MKKLFASFLFCLALTAVLMVFIDPVMAATAATSAATTTTTAVTGTWAIVAEVLHFIFLPTCVAIADKLVHKSRFASNNLIDALWAGCKGFATAFNQQQDSTGTTSSGGGASTGGTAAS